MDIYKETNEIESIHNLAPLEFISWKPSEKRKNELTVSGFKGMLEHLSSIHVQICHGVNVIEGGLRFAAFCREAVGVVHGEVGTGVFGGGLRPGERVRLEERIRGGTVRCEGVRDRFVEMGERHRGHIGQVGGFIHPRVPLIGDADLEVVRYTTASHKQKAKRTGKSPKSTWMWRVSRQVTAGR